MYYYNVARAPIRVVAAARAVLWRGDEQKGVWGVVVQCSVLLCSTRSSSSLVRARSSHALCGGHRKLAGRPRVYAAHTHKRTHDSAHSWINRWGLPSPRENTSTSCARYSFRSIRAPRRDIGGPSLPNPRRAMSPNPSTCHNSPSARKTFNHAARRQSLPYLYASYFPFSF